MRDPFLVRDPQTVTYMTADQFMARKGYLPMVTENLSSGDFRILSPNEYDMGQTKKRHGGVLKISDEEYERMLGAVMK